MKRIAIQVQGIVQGVGFRPFIYRLAIRLRLAGFVLNDSSGVKIEIQGTELNLSKFLHILNIQPPPLAQITSVASKDIPPQNDSDFKIASSKENISRQALISPDIATCPDCLEELLSPEDIRYQYPFINCTNCGPRYTIISDIPYDRKFTSMSDFEMCEECNKEYDDPLNRRFHAQPNACEKCGPHLSFYNSDKQINESDPIMEAISALENGRILAIKGLGGFHLAVDATNDQAVTNLRQKKHRFEKPLALMVKNMDSAEKIARIDETRRNILLSLQRPIVLCERLKDIQISDRVSLDNNWLGIMLPYTPVHELIFQSDKLKYLVMTSANISEEPICYENDECLRRMDGIADCYLIYNRDINIRCDDSVIQVFYKKSYFYRRSRGFAPRPVILDTSGPSVLAVGAHLKNTVCVTRDNYAFVSQHIGDLENRQTMEVFEHTISHLQNLNKIQPSAIIHDLHPEYLSSKWASENKTVTSHTLQHHYAHILSVMAENGIKDKIIGIALDGTGYGTDGAIWGGEILTCDIHSFKREAHFSNVPMPGGEKAIQEPWRMAVSYLLKDNDLGVKTAVNLFADYENEIKIIQQMLKKKINCPLTSSCGRLFDGVAAILGLRHKAAYEGQAAVILESEAKHTKDDIDIDKFKLIDMKSAINIDSADIIHNIVHQKLSGTQIPLLARAFHIELINVLTEVSHIIRDKLKINKLALSGGCFQNMILLYGLYERLEQDGFEVFINREVPTNDGGICLGQAWWGISR